MDDKHCSSCKGKIGHVAGSTFFTCPKCKEHEIVRCAHCRGLAVRYQCPGCKFEGPN